jgi:hypothetical protein
MNPLPATPDALVLRTDFSDNTAWREVCIAISAPSPGDGFLANVSFVEDRSFEGATVSDLVSAAGAGGQYRSFLFVVDGATIRETDHPVLVIDLADQPGRSFRVMPSEMWGVENNLSLANMDFDEFADAVDAAGIFRGFDGGV